MPYVFEIPKEITERNTKLHANKDATIERALKLYYKKHKLRYKDIKYMDTRIYRDAANFYESYYFKGIRICTWVNTLDGGGYLK